MCQKVAFVEQRYTAGHKRLWSMDLEEKKSQDNQDGLIDLKLYDLWGCCR